jgi:PKD repeat protein
MIRFILVLFLSLNLTVSAQITITNSHMPNIGDTLRYSTAATSGKTPLTKTGANQTWDFTDLTPISQGLDEYVRSSRTPYILNFGFSALGLKLADTLGAADFQLKNMYNFYKNSSSSFTDVGLGFQFSTFPLPQAGKHSDPDEIYTFPLKYQDKDTTTFKVKVPITLGIVPLGNFYRSGTRINIVDGWGTISTPYKKDVPCIRVKSIVTEFDSISISTLNLNFGIENSRVEYKWLSTTEAIPMLLVTGPEIAGNFIASDVRYRDDSRVIGPSNSITANFEVDKTISVKGQVLSFTNLTDGISLAYNWEITPTTPVVFVNGTSTSSENPKVVINDSGYYNVRLIASGIGARDTMLKSEYIHISLTSAIAEKATKQYQIYPNPVRNRIYVEVPQGVQRYQVKLAGMNGIAMYDQWNKAGSFIHTEDLAIGPYIITIIDEKNIEVLRRMVIIQD